MAYIVKWIVKNTKQDVIFTSLSSFWAKVENDETALAEHSLLSKKYVLERGGFLARDGLSVVHWMTFKDHLDFQQWEEDCKRIPKIDEDLTYTRIEEIDFTLYYPGSDNIVHDNFYLNNYSE